MDFTRRNVIESLLADGPILVRFATGLATLPEHLRASEVNALRLGPGLKPEVAWGTEENELWADLSFSGIIFRCRVPWVSIAEVIGEGPSPVRVMWPYVVTAKKPEPPASKRPGLRSV